LRVIGGNPEIGTGIHLIPEEYLFAVQLLAEPSRKPGHYRLTKAQI
jgi:hypothetical protein